MRLVLLFLIHGGGCHDGWRGGRGVGVGVEWHTRDDGVEDRLGQVDGSWPCVHFHFSRHPEIERKEEGCGDVTP